MKECSLIPAPACGWGIPAGGPPVLLATLDLALADQFVRATLPSVINLVVGALATDPSFTAAITAEVRRATSWVAEAVLFGEDLALPPALCETLEAVAEEEGPERMEVARETPVRLEHSGDSADKGDLIKLQ
ncbi:uncharacterized protein LOC144164700 [Haemaphysalis longicornis]